MLNLNLKNYLRLNVIIRHKLAYILSTLFLIFSLNIQASSNLIDEFPDEQSRQVYKNFLTDYEEYNSIYRLNFYNYETEENSKKLPCSFDKRPLYPPVEKCVKDLLEDGGWLVIGDSHGRDLYNTLKMLYPEQKIAMFQMSSCAPAKYKIEGVKLCFRYMPNIIKFINTNDSVKKVIFAARFQREPGTDQFIKDIRRGLYKKDVIIFNAGPAIEPDPMSYIKEQGIQDRYLISEEANQRVQRVNEKLNSTLSSNVKLFNKYNVFCNLNGSCKIINNLRSLFRDNDSHLLKKGMLLYGKRIKESKILE